MSPRPDQALARNGEPFEEARYGVGVAVGPAADRVHRALDRRVILAHRAVPPIGVAALVPGPDLQEQRHVRQTLQPHRPPALADQRGIGRMAHRAEEERRPAETRIQLGAAHVVHVVGVAIVGRADRDDGLERRRPARRNLQPVEAAPRDPHHADRAAAPGLGGQPGDDLDGVVLLLPGVLVGQQAVGFAAAADIDSHAGIAMAGQPRIGERVAFIGAVALAVGQIFQDRRHRILLGVLGQPDARGELRAVLQGDRRVLDDADGAGKGRDDQDGFTLPIRRASG